MAAHKWHKEICAWAEGKAIQYNSRGMWEDFDPRWPPNWDASGVEWRIKPAEPEREYVVTDLGEDELMGCVKGMTHLRDDIRDACNLALRHALDAGQIVTRAEFDRAVGDRQKRDMAVAEAVFSACQDQTRDTLEVNFRAIISQVK